MLLSIPFKTYIIITGTLSLSSDQVLLSGRYISFIIAQNTIPNHKIESRMEAEHQGQEID